MARVFGAGAAAGIAVRPKRVAESGCARLSALGLLVSNLKSEFSRTCLETPPCYALDRIAETYAALEAEAAGWLDAEGVPAEARRLTRQATPSD